VGVILNGVTGRMGMNQHLERSIMSIRRDGGVKSASGAIIVPEPILTGRNAEKLKALSEAHGGIPYSTDLDSLLSDSNYSIYFDSQVTPRRFAAVSKAMRAGKHVYCEKPLAATLSEAMRLVRLAEETALRNGAVQHMLWVPGICKLRHLINSNFFGRILSVRGEFGYWVFTGEDMAAQRPSWNYRAEDGGGIITDIFCHWRYLIENLFGSLKSVSCLGATHIDHRIDEAGHKYRCTADDSAYLTAVTDRNIVCNFNSSWCVRVRRDDLLVIQVDGTKGSAVAGLRECRIQTATTTPKAVWNPDVDSSVDYYSGWQAVAHQERYENAFKVQWELFLRHVAANEPYTFTFFEGAKGVQFAELAMQSWKERRWVDVRPLN
jgi:predicted dehydrogenase